MDLGRYLVERHLREGTSVAELAAAHGVHRSWLYKLLARYRAGGDAGLEARSRRPHHSPSRISHHFEDEIIALRKRLDTAGFDAGAQTIHTHLARAHRNPPSVSTIWRVLIARGFVTPQPHKRPRSSYIRFVAELPNECWQMDVTHWPLVDGNDVEILNIIDDHSRLCVATKAFRVVTAHDVVDTFHAAATWGYPASVLSDNGGVFTAAYRGGIGAMESELCALGITFKHSRPYHPQTCGKIERFHQTEKKFLAKQDPPPTIRALQHHLDNFVDYSNEQRPHRAIGRRTPLAAFNARTKAHPRLPAITIDGYRLRHDKIDRNGKITIRSKGRLHHIGLGRRHAGQTVAVLIAGRDIRILDETGQLIRQLVLDPTRDYQPQNQA
ncbi:MAG: IS481 family transposase [Ilumatobacteraceae bacterium]